MGDIAGFAFGGANAEIAVVAAGDFHLLAALKSAADVERDHGAVEIDVVARTGALDLADLLRFAVGGRKKKKQECKNAPVAQSGQWEIKMDGRFHTSIQPQELYRWQ